MASDGTRSSVGRVARGPTRPLFQTSGYDVFVHDDVVEVVYTGPFDADVGREVRALMRIARELGMGVRARVAPHRDVVSSG